MSAADRAARQLPAPDASDAHAVYAKTTRGAAEAAEHRQPLPTTVRRVLLLVDGRRSVAQLRDHARPGELAGILALLESLELIARIDSADTAAAAVSAERRALAELKRVLCGLFESELGGAGLVADARLRDSVSLDVLRRVLRESIDTARLRAGPACAQRLAARVRQVVRRDG